MKSLPVPFNFPSRNTRWLSCFFRQGICHTADLLLVFRVNNNSQPLRGRPRKCKFLKTLEFFNLRCPLAVRGTVKVHARITHKCIHSFSMFIVIGPMALCDQIMHGCQWYPSPWDIIWKWRLDTWILLIYWSLVNVNSAYRYRYNKDMNCNDSKCCHWLYLQAFINHTIHMRRCSVRLSAWSTCPLQQFHT